MDGKIKVHLTGPAKVGGRWLKAGEEHVTVEEFEALDMAGLIDHDRDGFKALVEAGDAKINATRGAENEALRVEVARRQAEASDLKMKLAAAEAVAVQLQGQVADLTVCLEDAISANANQDARAEIQAPDASGEKAPERARTEETPPGTDTPPSSTTAAKTTPKKGAAATKD